MRPWANVSLLLGHRLRRWPNSKPTLSQRFMFAGFVFADSVDKTADADQTIWQSLLSD